MIEKTNLTNAQMGVAEYVDVNLFQALGLGSIVTLLCLLGAAGEVLLNAASLL